MDSGVRPSPCSRITQVSDSSVSGSMDRAPGEASSKIRRQQSGHDCRYGFHGFMRLKLGAIRERNSTPHFSPFRVMTQAAGTVR